MPKPYWDPVLRFNHFKKRHLLLHLARIGIVSFRRSVKAHAGLFFVKKKIGADGVPWIRMVVDARQACRCHRRPPTVFFGSSRAMAELDLSDECLTTMGGFESVAGISLTGSDADVNDAFYNFKCDELASWFGLCDGFTTEDALSVGITHIWSDELGRMTPLLPGERLWAVVEALSMGWSWSLFFFFCKKKNH